MVSIPMITTEEELVAAVQNGGTVYCDSRVPIALSDTVPITEPTRVVGGHFTRDTGPAFDVTSSHVEFDGVRIDGGGRDAGYDATQKLIYVHGTKGAPLTDIGVHDCRLDGSRGDNIWLEWVVASTVHHNVITRYLYSGVMVVSGDGLTIDANVIADAALSAGVANVYGIALTDLTNVAADRSRHITVSGNHVSLVDWEGIDTHGGESLTFVGNTVIGCPRGIALVVGNETRVLVPTNCVVSGNTVDATGARRPLLPGIILVGIANKPASGTITGNQIVGYPTPFHTSFWARGETFIGKNSKPLVPWSPITIGADYTANPTYPPQYFVDGDTVHLRGGVIPKAGGVAARDAVGSLPNAAAWPDALSPVAQVKGSNPAAGTGLLAVQPSGEVQMLYGSGTDSYTYFLSGSYRAP
jgi:hypothetical protein